jgi:hypothetical protein
MTSTLVIRNQFNITAQGIVHKPTEAAFIPRPGDPHSGIVRLVNLKPASQRESRKAAEPLPNTRLIGRFS